MTLTITLTVSPGANSGTERLARMALICSRSSCKIAVMGSSIASTAPGPAQAWAADGGGVVGNRARSSPEPLALSMAVIGQFFWGRRRVPRAQPLAEGTQCEYSCPQPFG